MSTRLILAALLVAFSLPASAAERGHCRHHFHFHRHHFHHAVNPAATPGVVQKPLVCLPDDPRCP
jgi:hypothetical protein